MVSISKEALIELLKNGKELAFETIYKLYYDKLFHIAYNYLGRKENAEEIVQNVFLKLWAQMYRLDEINNLNAFLFAMTKNYCLDVLKHEKVKLRYAEEKRVTINSQFISDDTASLALENELRNKISEGIDLLPEKCKKVFIKSRIEGLKSAEIAKFFDISKRTVDNHISYGIRHMRIHLKDFISLFLLIIISNF